MDDASIESRARHAFDVCFERFAGRWCKAFTFSRSRRKVQVPTLFFRLQNFVIGVQEKIVILCGPLQMCKKLSNSGRSETNRISRGKKSDTASAQVVLQMEAVHARNNWPGRKLNELLNLIIVTRLL